MKKKILFAAALFAGSLAFAQGTTTSVKNSRGMEYLPQAGDWAIQFDAAPVLNYIGNAFSTGATTSPGAASTFGSNVFVGKKFTSATEAWRLKVGLNFQNATSFPDTVTTQNLKRTNVVLGFGKEWRRGHNRLQGFYGFEGLLSIGSANILPSFEYSDSAQGRDLGFTKSSALGIGARGFVGVEYFVLPKISIGGEFGWGLGYQTSSATRSTEANGSIAQTDVETKSSNFVINNDNGGSIFGGSASLNVIFHF